ncbi:allophanate hydrolase-related protein [Devosia sp. CN2-171]|uniref:allophanate hydrolase-related protein n=1 Tax=Devosia sp. CN2-171 TaxID=3400909 RepID=UPI003BF89EF4
MTTEDVGTDGIPLVVVGAHLSGMPLNGELQALGATFVKATATVPAYRLYALPGTVPPKPGLLRVAEGGQSIDVEVWTLDPAGFGLFVSRIPAPLGIGTLQLKNGDAAKGFLVEAVAIEGADDISHFGGWRSYVAQR